MFAALTGFLYIAAGNSLIIHYSFFTIHYSFSEALCKGTTFRGTGGRRSGTKGTLGRPPPIPLAVFPLHSLSPNLQPSPGHRYRCFGEFCKAILFAVSRKERSYYAVTSKKSVVLLKTQYFDSQLHQ